MRVDIDEPMLKQIAERTDGRYFRATDNKKLEEIYKQIDQLERSKIDVTEFRNKNDEYFPLAFLALGLIVFELLLSFTIFRLTT